MKYRVTINARYQKIRFEFDGAEYDRMTSFVNTMLRHRINGKDGLSDDDSEDVNKVEIELITEEDNKDAETES